MTAITGRWSESTALRRSVGLSVIEGVVPEAPSHDHSIVCSSSMPTGKPSKSSTYSTTVFFAMRLKIANPDRAEQKVNLSKTHGCWDLLHSLLGHLA